MKPLLTTAEVAARLAVTPDYVRDHARELGGIRLGGKQSPLRFEEERVDAFIERPRLPVPPAERQRRRSGSAPPPTESSFFHFPRRTDGHAEDATD